MKTRMKVGSTSGAIAVALMALFFVRQHLHRPGGRQESLPSLCRIRSWCRSRTSEPLRSGWTISKVR